MNLVKVAGYKINTQKSLAYLYTNNEKSERGNKQSIPFITATKRIKYQGIDLHTETKDLYWEDNKILIKEIKDDTDGETYHVLGMEKWISSWKWW